MSSSMGHESSGSGGADEEDSSGLQRVVWFRQMLHRWQSSSSSRSATASEMRSSASDHGDGDGDGDGANQPDAATTDRNNDGDDATLSAADNASSRNLPQLTASHSSADDDDRRLRLPRVLVVEERSRRDDAAAACESPMTPDDAAAPADVPRGCCPVYVGAAERRRFVVPTAYLGMPVFRRLLEKAEEEFEFHYHGGAVTIPCDTEAFKYILVVMDRHRQGLVDDDGNDKHGEQDASPSESQAREQAPVKG